MNDQEQNRNPESQRDPLGLSGLSAIMPEHDDWSRIRAALSEDQDLPVTANRRRRPVLAWAIAASVVVAVGLMVARMPSVQVPATDIPAVASTPDNTDTHDLIAMSQVLERRLRQLRSNTGALPAQSVLWVTELEDMIARVDGELTVAPESVELWGQRVSLMLDLESIYVHQFEREYGRMASL